MDLPKASLMKPAQRHLLASIFSLSLALLLLEAGRLQASSGRDHPEDDLGPGVRGGAGPSVDDNGGSHGGNSGSNGSGKGARLLTKARLALTRPDDAVDGNAKGRVEARSKKGRERLEIKAERLDPGLAVVFLLADESGDLQEVATAVANARGQAKAKWDTKKTDLPLGAALVAELAGRAVAVVTAEGGALLAGVVPDLGALSESGGSRQRGLSTLTNVDAAFAPEGKGKVVIDERAARGRSKLAFEVEHVPPGSSLEVFLENPASALLEKVADLAVGPRGEGEVELETQDGVALPFGATLASELSGKDVELRSPDGSVRFTAMVPTP